MINPQVCSVFRLPPATNGFLPESIFASGFTSIIHVRAGKGKQNVAGEKRGQGTQNRVGKGRGAALWRRWELEARKQAAEHGVRKGTSGGAAGHEKSTGKDPGLDPGRVLVAGLCLLDRDPARRLDTGVAAS